MNGTRSKNIFDPAAKKPFKLSRSKIEDFLRCPLCFYLDRRLGVAQPPGFPFTLNNAVDRLLKKEFDIHRAGKTTHPLMKHYGIDAVPFQHPDLSKWRENFIGIRYHHAPANFIVTGAIDDVWVNKKGELMIVDYKATSTESPITLDAEYRQGYKRQMEIYQWLFRKNGFTVSDTGYFVYVNALKDKAAFDGKLEFDVQILSYTGSDAWVKKTLSLARKCLMSDTPPKGTPDCDFCNYRAAAQKALGVVSRKKNR
ncbi:PD-(D/E)XK nuclease family protein [Candidatus Azambacteria bacterium]|nr:PD-(D/E)XK nuclease family protein [Candidatus Azambacteria bacterium]MBI3685546.1 PD-(D/E)XK nuclease family protein [Candidatus Azambacteria bacterium]